MPRKAKPVYETVMARRMKRGAISKKRVLMPRPFLGPALDAAIANGLLDRVQAPVMSGLNPSYSSHLPDLHLTWQ